jgi:hypothetical protein
MRLSQPPCINRVAKVRNLKLLAASALTKIIRARPLAENLGIYSIARIFASANRVFRFFSSSRNRTTTIVTPRSERHAGAIKRRLFPLPIGRTTTSGVSLAKIARRAISCSSDLKVISPSF